MKAPRRHSNSSKSQTGKHLSTFRNLYRSKISNCRNVEFFRLRFLIVFICRALCGNINKLSKAVKIFNDSVTPNNRKSICSRRVIYPTFVKFSVCHFLVPRLRYFLIMLPWTVLWIARRNNWSISVADFEFLKSVEQFFKLPEKSSMWAIRNIV